MDRLKATLLGDIFSAIGYGIVVVLSGNCVHLLQKKRGIYSNRIRILLLIYVIFILLCSTWEGLQSVCEVMVFITPQDWILPIGLFQFELPLIIWGADGFMVRILIIHQEQSFTMQLQIWRCLVLYQGVSRGSRAMIIVLLSLVSFASFGRPISISTSPPIQIAHKILSVRRRGVCLGVRSLQPRGPQLEYF